VAVVDSVADKRGSRAVAEAYLLFLYTPEGQEIAARNFSRPRDPAVASRHQANFPQISLATIQDFGGWDKAQAAYFADGGLFDRIYTPGK
jgi:sulfate transport system substrate-binding protein